MKSSPSAGHALSPVELITFEFVTLDRQGALFQRASGQARQVVETLPGGVKLELICIPKGSFQMGSRHEGGYPDEQPLHPVFLDSFWMGKYPLTQAQWQAVLGRPAGCRFHGPDLPVENICWKDASAFCERLTRLTGHRYGLPSEAQWEYACRAGTASPFSLGETITTEYANYVGEHVFRAEPPGVYRHSTTPGSTFLPNPWGLYDMHGNVWEFCADPWTPDYSGAAPEPACRVARGGSWHEIPGNCRSAVRLRVEMGDRAEYYGMRVIMKEG